MSAKHERCKGTILNLHTFKALPKHQTTVKQRELGAMNLGQNIYMHYEETQVEALQTKHKCQRDLPLSGATWNILLLSNMSILRMSTILPRDVRTMLSILRNIIYPSSQNINRYYSKTCDQKLVHVGGLHRHMSRARWTASSNILLNGAADSSCDSPAYQHSLHTVEWQNIVQLERETVHHYSRCGLASSILRVQHALIEAWSYTSYTL